MTVALALTKRHITAKEAIELGRLEEEFQVRLQSALTSNDLTTMLLD